MKTLDKIAAELAGYDPQAMRASIVTAFLTQLVEPLTEVQGVGIFQALGRVLAADVISPINVPPHDNSAMDGYAFDGRQLNSDQSLRLKVIGTALAGKVWTGALRSGECLKIMTGAVMPPGVNTVVPQELVTPGATQAANTLVSPPLQSASEASNPHEAQYITITPGSVRLGVNCRYLGEDLMQGQPALRKGELLTPAALGLLASLGLQTVPVLRQLKVAYFSTGNEILSLGEPPREGAVYDSNRYTIFGLLTRLGCDVIDMGVVRDEPAALHAAFEEAALRVDAIITSGGVSVGEADYTKTVMKQLGHAACWRIAMRPGRPMVVGQLFRDKFASGPFCVRDSSYFTNSNQRNSAILFGLPGNPVAVMVTFLAFVRPALLKMMGCSASAPPLLQAKSLEVLRKKPGRTEYQRGIVNTAPDGTLQVKSTGNQGSGLLSSMVQANGLIVLRHAQGDVAVGDTVDVMMFDGVI